MASVPVRWWRAILALIQFNHDSANNGWVEPGNAITRAVLSGRAISLGAPKPSAVMAAPVVLPEEAPIAPAAAEENETAAAQVALEAEAPVEKPARRRAGRAA